MWGLRIRAAGLEHLLRILACKSMEPDNETNAVDILDSIEAAQQDNRVLSALVESPDNLDRRVVPCKFVSLARH